MLWTDIYQPTSLNDLKGNEGAFRALKKLILEKKTVLLYGPVGCGKTSSVHALSKELDLELIEVNASDFRDKESIQNIVGNSLSQMSLFQRQKIILVDEIDGVEGDADRGGVTTLAGLLDQNAHAVVLTANNPWDTKFSTLRKKSTLIEFKAPNYLHVYGILRHICDDRGIRYHDEDLKTLAKKDNGDIRAAINDLQALTEHTKELQTEDLDIVADREREQSIFGALRTLFKSKDQTVLLGLFDTVDADIEEIMLWVDENLVKEYAGEDLFNAYELLSRIDIFNRRIRRWQHWRFLAYMYDLLTAGIGLIKTKTNPNFVTYQRTTRILKLWLAKQKYAKRKSIAEKLAPGLHSSARSLIKDTIPYLKLIAHHQKKVILELEDEEMEWLQQ